MTRSTTALLRDIGKRPALAEAVRTHEVSPDLKAYPQGWSLAMIEREAFRRYRRDRDEQREQDWEWAVVTVARMNQLSAGAVRAANLLYETQQLAVGDVEHRERVGDPSSADAVGWLWAQTRATALAQAAKAYVEASPEATEARLCVFRALFEVWQPTLDALRVRARPGGSRTNVKGNVIRMNHREVVERVKWALETLAEFFQNHPWSAEEDWD